MEMSMLIEVKAILKSLVLSSTEKITIDKLNRDYREVEGQFIPFRQLGYGNLEQFLRSIPDTLMVFGSGPTAMVCFVANEKSDHIHDMIMKQKKSKSKGARSRPRSVSARNNVSNRNNRFNNINNQSNKKVGQQLSPFQSVNRNHLTKTIQVRDVPKPYCMPPPLYDQLLYPLPQPSGIVLNTQQSLNLKYALENQPQISSLLQKQCYLTKPPPPFPRQQTRAVQFSSVTNSTKQPAAETNNISPAKSLTVFDSKNVINEIKVPKAAKQMPTKLSEEVESFVDMPKLYKPTNPIKEGRASDNIKEIPKEEKRPLIKQTKTIFDDTADWVEDPDEAVPSFAAKNNVFRLDFPDDTVKYGYKITPFKLSDDVTVGSRIQIFISEIHNPFKFWFHMNKDNNELDMLMYKIERFYSPLYTEELQIPMNSLTPGQVCAALYNGLWHRAEIVAPPISTTIKVSFMDYGTVDEVEIENIKFLVSHFSELPAQALRGCLSHIKPRALHWSHDATTYFLTLVEELMLYAQIYEIDREENILYMVLCNTYGDEVVQINKALVEKRYALYDDQWKPHRISQNNGKRIHHPREDYPTFSMIESGEYPSFRQLVNLRQSNIDYEAIHDRIIFNQSTILNKHDNAPEAIRNLPYFLTTSNPFRSDILMALYATTLKAI